MGTPMAPEISVLAAAILFVTATGDVEAQTAPTTPSQAPTGNYWDWPLGGDYAIRGTPPTVNVSWIDTDISRRRAAHLQPSFSNGQDGRGSIAGSTLLAPLTAAF